MLKDIYIQLLKEYDLLDSISGDEAYIRCPAEANHKHGDQNRSASFNLVKQAWICYGCGERGGIHRLIALYNDSTLDIAKATWDNYISTDIVRESNIERIEHNLSEVVKIKNSISVSKQSTEFAQLIGATTYHSYLKDRGISQATANKFGVGYSDKYNRILLPVFDLNAERVLRIQCRAIEDVNPKYVYIKFEDKAPAFFGTQTIDNWSEVIIVEGVFGVLTLYEHGVRNVLATLGQPTQEQIELLNTTCGRLILLFDRDKAGEKYKWRVVNNTTVDCMVPTVAYVNTDEILKDQWQDLYKSKVTIKRS